MNFSLSQVCELCECTLEEISGDNLCISEELVTKPRDAQKGHRLLSVHCEQSQQCFLSLFLPSFHSTLVLVFD